MTTHDVNADFINYDFNFYLNLKFSGTNNFDDQFRFC